MYKGKIKPNVQSFIKIIGAVSKLDEINYMQGLLAQIGRYT